MLKRKRGEPPELGRFGLSLAIGVIVLVVLSLVGVVALLTIQRPEAMPIALIRTATPPPSPTRYRTNTPPPSPTRVPMPTGLPRLPVGGSLVYSTTVHEIGSFDGDGMRILKPKGNDVTVSPDGQAMAYIRDTQLFVYRGGKETPINIGRGTVQTPIWNLDGTALIFVVQDSGLDTIVRWNGNTDKLATVLTVRQLAAPPQPVPGEHRLLIAEFITQSQTTLYTIDELCNTIEACQATRQDLTTVAQNIRWMAYHPSGIYIFFIDGNSGGIFALSPSTLEVIPVADDHFFRLRLATGRDPGKLVYIDGNLNLYLFDLNSRVSQRLLPTAVVSVSWSGGG